MPLSLSEKLSDRRSGLKIVLNGQCCLTPQPFWDVSASNLQRNFGKLPSHDGKFNSFCSGIVISIQNVKQKKKHCFIIYVTSHFQVVCS